MKARFSFRVLAVLLIAVIAIPQTTPPANQSTPSAHRIGPNGYEGWTLDSSIPDLRSNETFPTTLIIARKGRIVRKIDGSPFVWNWIFWKNGRQVAYETGPLHSSLQCNLVSVVTGKTLASYDCFYSVPDNAPGWLKNLEDAH